MQTRLDDLDRAIVSLLSHDARVSNRQIAGELYLAVGTVRSHIHNIMGKLDAQNRTEAVAKAQALGILK